MFWNSPYKWRSMILKPRGKSLGVNDDDDDDDIKNLKMQVVNV